MFFLSCGSTLHQLLTHAAFYFVNALYLALRKESAVLLVVFLAKVKDALAACELLLHLRLCLFFALGIALCSLRTWTDGPQLFLVFVVGGYELCCGGFVKCEVVGYVLCLFLGELFA